LLGQGSNGGGGVPSSGTAMAGGAGSGGNSGSCRSGGAFGGGSGGNASLAGAVGAVRIIYPGTSRSFPSTNTGNL
jgi:hypothetical protein